MKISLTLEANREVLGHLLHWDIIKVTDLLVAGVIGDQVNAVVEKAVLIGKVESIQDVQDKMVELCGLLRGADVVLYAGPLQSPADPPPPPPPSLVRGYKKMPDAPAGMVPCMIDWYSMSDTEIYYQRNGMRPELWYGHVSALDVACQSHIMSACNRHLQELRKSAQAPLPGKKKKRKQPAAGDAT